MIAYKDVDAILKLAHELAATSFSEVAALTEGETPSVEIDEYKLRSAVSRAYYSVFLLARHKTRINQPDNAHSVVIGAVTRRSKNLGDALRELKEYRQSADYDFPPKDEHKDWEKNWATVSKKSTNLINLFKNW